MPKLIGCAATRDRGGLVFAAADGFGILDVRTGAIIQLVDPEEGMPHNRFNDGKVDRRGRLWAGTINCELVRPTGSLYRLDPDHTIHRMDTGFVCSNGLGWSPDGATMYFTDSMVRTIWAYDFDENRGTVSNRRVFAKLSDDDGVPDGLAVDAEGFVWSAVWDGWRVVRFAPDGSVVSEIPMPAQRPSSCMFGGVDLKTLYITSACAELTWPALQTGPLAGALFSIRTDVPGMPEPVFMG
jgi:sugar lactone lactonase YvrE